MVLRGERGHLVRMLPRPQIRCESRLCELLSLLKKCSADCVSFKTTLPGPAFILSSPKNFITKLSTSSMKGWPRGSQHSSFGPVPSIWDHQRSV